MGETNIIKNKHIYNTHNSATTMICTRSVSVSPNNKPATKLMKLSPSRPQLKAGGIIQNFGPKQVSGNSDFLNNIKAM